MLKLIPERCAAGFVEDPQSLFICLKSTIRTPEQCVKTVQR